MKQIIMATIILLTRLFSGHAQSPVLKEYYELKEALVNSNPVTASASSAELSKALDSMDIKSYPVNMQTSFTEIRKKLISDANRIVTTRDVSKQREYFANLSLNIYSLAKMIRLSDQPVYQAYCPMKKMYWLSNEKNIRNPYYGKMMLTCGSLTETINP